MATPATVDGGTSPGSQGLPVAKGHGTENDFVLVPDPDGRLDLTPAQVAALCDRRAGLGGDGLIRVVRADALPEGLALPAPVSGPRAEWFMDYRNGDGSVAEMCGNGVRVFVAYLLHAGLAELPDGQELAVGSRAGTKTVRRVGDGFAVDLGPWRVTGGPEAAARGFDAGVGVHGEPTALPGLSVDLGNPHVVVALPSLELLAAADLTRPPAVDPVPPDGVNVELVVPMHDATSAAGHLTMRVHERGVGETRSCGTGAVAAVLAARVWAGDAAPDTWTVDVRGGRLQVHVPAQGRSADGLAGAHAVLTGPAVVVAEGEVDPGWLAAAG